ncbi:hypothetical protein TNCT_613231 [Trichonephila clavata]|uniref:Uncharacterized protein n=1 Tax=Trichonephila clavata TaxID=2740835 RepID=A0A8X6GW28_TRICU|nr:hypothetical protein TNCT_613231 [Trichonephila clavata]
MAARSILTRSLQKQYTGIVLFQTCSYSQRRCLWSMSQKGNANYGVNCLRHGIQNGKQWSSFRRIFHELKYRNGFLDMALHIYGGVFAPRSERNVKIYFTSLFSYSGSEKLLFFSLA